MIARTARSSGQSPSARGSEQLHNLEDLRQLPIDRFRIITVAEEHTHQYVTAIIHVRAKRVTVITLNGEIVHQGNFALSRTLR
jgi:hypothetical protein